MKPTAITAGPSLFHS